MCDFKYIYDIDINNKRMKTLRAFGDFLNESRSGVTEQQVKDVLSKFDEQTRRDIVSFLCNDEESDDGEIHTYLVDELGIPDAAADDVVKVAQWFRLDYMDYCLKNGGDEGLYENTQTKTSFVDMRKRLESKTNESSVDIKRKPHSQMNEYQGKFDVTKSPKSIAAKVEPLIREMDKMNLEEIRSKFSAIVNDRTRTHPTASDRNGTRRSSSRRTNFR